MDCLSVCNIWKSYDLKNKEKVTVLKGLNLSVEPGDMVAVMGPSGSGKTTLLNIISGVDRPDRGSVQIEGRNLAEISKTEMALFRRQQLGMVFQDFNLLESLSVKENILLPMILDGKSAEEQEQRAERLFNILSIGDIQDKNITEISGGQKQRAAIGRALVNNPAILLADEPTGNLDPKSTGEVMRYFSHINRETGTGILMVTHDVYAASCCRRAVLLKDGKLTADICKKDNRKEFLNAITEMLALLGGDQDDII